MSFNADTNQYDGYIYCIENVINQKKYIGQTRTTIQERFNQHLFSANNGEDTYLYNSIRFHGADAFIVYEVCKVSSVSKKKLLTMLNRLEIQYIKEFSTFKPNGYNMTPGGQALSKDISRSVYLVNGNGDVIKMYESIRQASYENGIDERNIQHACKSVSHFSGGLFWYYCDSIEVSIGDNIGKQRRGENNNKERTKYFRKRICMASKDGTKIKEFASAIDAERELNISHAHISRCCNGIRKTAGGYMWFFID